MALPSLLGNRTERNLILPSAPFYFYLSGHAPRQRVSFAVRRTSFHRCKHTYALVDCNPFIFEYSVNLRHRKSIRYCDMDSLTGVGGQTPPYPDENRGPLLLRVTWSLISISAIVVIGRICTKLSKTRRLYADDICMFFALVSYFPVEI